MGVLSFKLAPVWFFISLACCRKINVKSFDIVLQSRLMLDIAHCFLNVGALQKQNVLRRDRLFVLRNRLVARVLGVLLEALDLRQGAVGMSAQAAAAARVSVATVLY